MPPSRVESGAGYLAREAPFSLGALRVVPAARFVERDGQRETLEPRVMQVLVELARAGGEVVSRDELIARCWSGRVVVDNAINRCISILRRLSSTLGDGCFRIETVAKVGYRLVEAGATVAPAGATVPEPRTECARETATPSSPPPLVPAVEPLASGEPPGSVPASESRLSRRKLMAGVLSAAVLTGGMGLFVRARSRDHELARELLRRGRDAALADTSDALRQSIAYLERATAADPEWAEPWGVLAVVLQVSSEHYRDDYARRAMVAAERALALDADNADGLFVMALREPAFRNWETRESVCRALLGRFSGHLPTSLALGRVLLDTGRCREAAELGVRITQDWPHATAAAMLHIRGAWGSGDSARARRVLESASRFWPASLSIWNVHIEYLGHEGRAGAAMELLEDPNWVPSVPSTVPVDVLKLAIEALDAGVPSKAAAAREALLSTRPPHGRTAFAGSVATWLAMLDAPDEALRIAEDYLIGYPDGPDGRRQPPIGDRSTWWLFQPPMARLREHSRRTALVRDVGLEEFWRRTGTHPGPAA